jgi:hypothetical protein
LNDYVGAKISGEALKLGIEDNNLLVYNCYLTLGEYTRLDNYEKSVGLLQQSYWFLEKLNQVKIIYLTMPIHRSCCKKYM